MFHELVENPGDRSPEELYERYVDELRAAIETAGIDDVAAETDVDEETLRALVDGDDAEVTLEEAASILAANDGNRDPDEIETVSRDALLMGMSMAVLDVEALASGIGGELEPREIQSKAEGRFPMTLREFALLYQYIESEKR